MDEVGTFWVAKIPSPSWLSAATGSILSDFHFDSDFNSHLEVVPKSIHQRDEARVALQAVQGRRKEPRQVGAGHKRVAVATVGHKVFSEEREHRPMDLGARGCTRHHAVRQRVEQGLEPHIEVGGHRLVTREHHEWSLHMIWAARAPNIRTILALFTLRGGPYFVRPVMKLCVDEVLRRRL